MALTFRIVTDEDPESPRDWSNLGTMVCGHRRYRLGDTGHGIDPAAFDSWEDLERWLEKERGAAVILPLYLYDHSGITMATGRFSCPWDSGRVGLIYADRDTILREYGRKRCTAALLARVTEGLEAEVRTYDTYLRGNVCGYIVEDEEGRAVDSCFGFYSAEEATAEAESYIRWAAEHTAAAK